MVVILVFWMQVISSMVPGDGVWKKARGLRRTEERKIRYRSSMIPK